MGTREGIWKPLASAAVVSVLSLATAGFVVPDYAIAVDSAVGVEWTANGDVAEAVKEVSDSGIGAREDDAAYEGAPTLTDDDCEAVELCGDGVETDPSAGEAPSHTDENGEGRDSAGESSGMDDADLRLVALSSGYQEDNYPSSYYSGLSAIAVGKKYTNTCCQIDRKITIPSSDVYSVCLNSNLNYGCWFEDMSGHNINFEDGSMWVRENANSVTQHRIWLNKGTYYFTVRNPNPNIHNPKQTYAYSVSRVASWSGASYLPLSATADYKVTNGGYIRLKSGGKWVKSDSVLSLSAPSATTKRITARGTGSTTLYLLDSAGNQVASKKVTVYGITSGKWEMQSSVDENYVLDIRGRSKANGARMIVWKRNNQSNQRYQFQRQADGTYLIRCCHSGRFVDVQYGGGKRGQAVIQWARNARDNQRWRISVDAYNRVTFTCKMSGMCFDIQGGKITSAAQMIQWPANGQNNQKWVLNKK